MNIPFLHRPAPVQFTQTGVPLIKRTGPVFYSGDFSDKGIGVVTDADLDAIARASTDAVAFNSEHGHSLFDGLLGYASNFRVARDAQGRKAIFADWHEPEPLAQLLGTTPRTPSVEFADWASRKITGIALARFPRIADAAFFSALQGAYVAFSAHQPVVPLEVAAANFAAPAPLPALVSPQFAFYTPTEQGLMEPEDCGDPANLLFPARTEDEMYQSIEQLWNAADPTLVRNNLFAIAQAKGFRTDSYRYPSARPGISAPRPDPAPGALNGYDPYFSVSGQNVAQNFGISYNRIANAGEWAAQPEMNSPLYALQNGQLVPVPVQGVPAQGVHVQPGAAAVPQMATHAQIQGVPVVQGAHFAQVPVAAPAAPQSSGSLWDRIANAFGASDSEKQTLAAQFSATPKTPREIELENQVAQLQAGNPGAVLHPQIAAQFAQAQRAQVAGGEAQRLLTENRILPHQLQSVAAEFSRALEDDEARPAPVQFSQVDAAGRATPVNVSRADALRAHFAALAPHNLTQEKVPEFAPETVALFSREVTQAATAKADPNTYTQAEYDAIAGQYGLPTAPREAK